MNSIENLKDLFIKDLIEAKKLYDIRLIRSKYLGAESILLNERKKISSLSLEEKKIYGPKIQNIITEIEDLINKKNEELQNNTFFKMDLSIPVYNTFGSKHILSKEIENIKNIFRSLDFKEKDAPEIEDIFFNFDALNIGSNHPCRDDHQSFFLNNNKILRTQTSNAQIHSLLDNNSNMSIFSIGRTYRRDWDRTHTPMFHQVECFKTSANLQSMFSYIKKFLNLYFQKSMEIRIRPSFFPFTEPSFEIDIKLNNEWLEIMGCGIIHPNIFKNCNIEYKVSFAFGCGVERIIMLKYNINDIRDIYTSNIVKLKELTC
jgi:phenylalanyl-tRNA synthetase alpha chain